MDPATITKEEGRIAVMREQSFKMEKVRTVASVIAAIFAIAAFVLAVIVMLTRPC